MNLRVDVKESQVQMFRRLLSLKNISWRVHPMDPEATILENVIHFTMFSVSLTVYSQSWFTEVKIQRDLVTGLAPA